jgi:2-phospho-L-lactate guanylyltransferase
VRTAAILPVKSFVDAKRRLRRELPPAERRALAAAMFSDVLLALRRASTVGEIIVVSADHGVQRIAEGFGIRVLGDDERGHNAAATLGVRGALEARADRALLVPGDCPALDPADIDELLARPATHPSVLIVPDRHGTGTNALLLTPPDALAPSFGPDSRRRHLAEAGANGTGAEVVEIDSLAYDVDTPDDLAALRARLASSHGGAPHTRGLLAQLMHSEA